MQPRTVHVNGQYLPENEARISIFDRGFLFADAVYEVCAVLDGQIVDFAGHMKRLHRSLAELDMAYQPDEAALLDIHRELVRRNGIDQGLVYLQITRGVSDRNFVYAGQELTPTIALFTQHKPLLDSPAINNGLRVMTLPDTRWGRRDIKTVQLLSAVLAKTEAKRQGADDAWLVEDGHINEGSSSNVWIVDQDGVLTTPALSHSILHGITRAAVLRYAEENDIEVRQGPVTVDQARAAREAFVTSATSFVTPVVEIDGTVLGDGKPGPVSRRLMQIYTEESRRRAI